MMATRYNGWENYPTWAVRLWLDNDEASQERALEMAKQAVHDAKTPLRFNDMEIERKADGLLADHLRVFVQNEEPHLPASMFSDLLGWAIGQVNWYELAASYIQDATEVTA